MEHLEWWLEKAAETWEKIERFSHLISFADVKHMKDDRDLKEKVAEWERDELKGQKGEHDKLVQVLIREHIDRNRLHVVHYADDKLSSMRKEINQYFDAVYNKMERMLARLREERDFRQDLVNSYKRNIRSRVDQYCFETQDQLQRRIQSIKVEVGRVNGQEELETKIRELIRSGQKIDEKRAKIEFDAVWKTMVNARKAEMKLSIYTDVCVRSCFFEPIAVMFKTTIFYR